MRSLGSQTTKARLTRLRLARLKTASVERRSEIPVLALRGGAAIDPACNLETALANEADMAHPEVYRINLKTDAEDREALIKYCLERGVLGMGWGCGYFSAQPLKTFDSYWAGATRCWPTAAARGQNSPRRFHDAQKDDLVWFRDLQGQYYLARLTGDWEALHGPRAEALDLGQVRAVEYRPVGSEADVPGKVIRSYAAPRQLTFCRVDDPGAETYTRLLASELFGYQPPDFDDLSTATILASLLSPFDVEDLVAAYLQDTKDYVALPARHSKNTAVYEWILKNRNDGHVAVAQVKTGNATIDVQRLNPDIADMWFAYVAADQDLPAFVHRISNDELIAYMGSGAPSLPPVVERWMRAATRHG